MLVFAGSQKHIRIWNFKQNKETGRLDGHKTAILAVAVSPDDDDPDDPTPTTLASGSQDGVIKLWNFKARSQHGPDLKGHDGEVTALAFNPTDANIFASAGTDRVIKVWDIETNKTRRKSTRAASFSPWHFRRTARLFTLPATTISSAAGTWPPASKRALSKGTKRSWSR